MSDEGWVTPSDMMQDIVAKAGNAWFWAKGLSAHGGGKRKPFLDTVPNKSGKQNFVTSRAVNLCGEGRM